MAYMAYSSRPHRITVPGVATYTIETAPWSTDRKTRLYPDVTTEMVTEASGITLPASDEDFAKRAVVYRKMAREQAMETLIAMGLDNQVASINWNRKAGCTCGCSPGFVITTKANTKGMGDENGHRILDINVYREPTTEEVERQAAAARRNLERKVEKLEAEAVELEAKLVTKRAELAAAVMELNG